MCKLSRNGYPRWGTLFRFVTKCFVVLLKQFVVFTVKIDFLNAKGHKSLFKHIENTSEGSLHC